MKKMIQKKLMIAGIMILSAFATTNLSAQGINCGTTEMMKKVFDANPELYKQYLASEVELAAQDKIAAANNYLPLDKAAITPVYTIPVVFHVIEEGGSENISDAQIFDEMRILNEDYAKLNPDTSAIVPSFLSVASGVGVQFKLAQKDPNGNCTNGIDRVYSSLTNAADDGSKLNDWPRNKYLNVWTVKTIGTAGVAGYAYLPAGAGSTVDGVLILSNYIGSIGTGSVATSRALTHEIGHYLNLNHTWGGTNNPGVACGDDGVTDTPITMGHTSCTLTDATCTPPIIENVQNYMEYAYCSNMFTAGQKNRMRSALTSGTSSRNNLWTAANLTATGVSTPAVLCAADFLTNSITSNVLCQGDSITFIDNSWNGNPTSWNWTFPGGTPASSTDSMPVVHYNTPGYYNVSLTVGNASGSVSTTKTNYIRVNPSTASYASTFYSESFEGAAIPSADWQVNNLAPGGNTWTQTTAAAVTATHSVRIVNNAAADGSVDELISPSIDMTHIAGATPTLTFKLAYAQSSTTTNDKLQVYVSTTCGKTWTLRLSLTGSALATAPVTTSSFVPTASQWVQKSSNLTGFASQPNLYILFRFTSNGGNNIYIDDINISGTVGFGDDLSNAINYNVYPNPADENTLVSFNLISPEKTSLKVYDVVGREISTLVNTQLGAGEYTYPIADKATLSAGVYFVTLTAGDHTFTKKLIVK
jgi:PKD repeat protein